MAVLTAQAVRSPVGGIVNPALTAAMHGFAADLWPPQVMSMRRIRHTALTTHVPVQAHGRAIDAQPARSFYGDYYNRIHISPQRLDLGNVVSTQTSAVAVWNAYLVPRTLVNIEGTDEGILLSGQPVPPLLIPAMAELTWQVSVTPDGQPVLDTTVEWEFDGFELAGLRITANRIIGWPFVPDWADGVLERLVWLTDVLQSETAVTQRRALRIAPRREFEAPMYVEGRERQLLDLALFEWGSRIWALPIWHELQLLTADLAAGATAIACSTANLDFRVGGLAMLRAESAFVTETVEIVAIASDSLTLKRATQLDWPRGSRLYPVRSAQLVEEPVMTRLTDMASSLDVHFLIAEPCDWPAVMPATLYRGRPVYEQRPEESEDLTSQFQRLLSTLDSTMAIPRITDLANQALPMQGHRWLGAGRVERAAYRSLLYALAGRQKAVWLPTHADDLTLVAAVAGASVTIDVAALGYTRFARSQPGRRDMRIELWGGTVFYRRITGSAEISLDIERLQIDAAFGRVIQPGDVMRISWMVLCTLASDTVEIEHLVDSEGIASSKLTFQGVRDDEF